MYAVHMMTEVCKFWMNSGTLILQAKDSEQAENLEMG